jgi:hydrogenase/urease accessory protein HupE
MQKFTALPAIILLIGANSLLAHPGHHHETGLPDFAAHVLLGLQYLAALLIPAAAIAFFLRAARRKKSRPASLTNQEK